MGYICLNLITCYFYFCHFREFVVCTLLLLEELVDEGKLYFLNLDL